MCNIICMLLVHQKILISTIFRTWSTLLMWRRCVSNLTTMIAGNVNRSYWHWDVSSFSSASKGFNHRSISVSRNLMECREVNIQDFPSNRVAADQYGNGGWWYCAWAVTCHYTDHMRRHYRQHRQAITVLWYSLKFGMFRTNGSVHFSIQSDSLS